jgi:hypothetical protein
LALRADAASLLGASEAAEVARRSGAITKIAPLSQPRERRAVPGRPNDSGVGALAGHGGGSLRESLGGEFGEVAKALSGRRARTG